ncbi:hypothetical protein KDD93_07610 [Campylobacter sp. faydin G-24]|uniref:Uncharacterized protein n=1 Tax=Campylobacter anatolicus TaxID=2829105 RepID=A0ABS5HJI9_9BACT|nr:hypothetical protein [Campylobacter anatolicus]MBR8464429.1 hypothetical protein [Campylobacter anatolicus]
MLQNYTQQLFTTEKVAKNYSTTLANIQKTKQRHSDEITENIHYFKTIEQTNGGRQKLLNGRSAVSF